MRKPLARLLLSAFLALTAGAAAAQAPVVVFAAASLKNALDAAATDWQSRTGEVATISYAGSSALAQQIAQGAPTDIFISAAVDWMDRLEKDNLIQKASRFDLLANRLVLIGSADSPDITPAELPERLGTDRLAMALVDSVPAGVYGKQSLTALGLWDKLAPQVAQAENVRASLALVARGEAPFGITYATDAVAEPRVRVVATFPPETHDPIIYPAALTASSANPAAKSLLDFLASPDAAPHFESQGFRLLK